MILKFYLASVVTCCIVLIFYVRRLKIIEELRYINWADMIITYLLLSIPSFIPLVNIFCALTWIINAFIISEYEFISIHSED